MAPTKRKTTHNPETTEAGEHVLDLVLPYIHNVDDRTSVSLVSRKLCENVGIMIKRVTVHTRYSNPSRLTKRFPFIESLTLRGPPSSDLAHTYYNDIQITPWIEQLALEFRYLKELHIRHLVVNDEDLKTLATTRGKDLRSLKINKCKGFSTHGLRHVSEHCNQLRTMCLRYSAYTKVKDETWLHQLALNNTVLEMFHYKNMDISDAEDVTLLANNCCKSLISLKLGACCLSKLGDVFKCVVRLEHFGGCIRDEVSELVDFQFPPNMRSLSLGVFRRTPYSTGLPFLNHITKLKLSSIFNECQCLLFKKCPNLEVLHTSDVCGDKGLLVIGEFCKKLRKLDHFGFVTHVGLIAMAKGCTNLESLKVRLEGISNEALECLGTHLKNLRKFHMDLVNKDRKTVLPLDNGILAMLVGCSKLESLDVRLRWHKGLTDVGLEYIGKYGANLRYLSLTLPLIGNSDAGLVKLSEGCLRLKKLRLWGCPFSKDAVASCMFNIPSLRVLTVQGSNDSVVREEKALGFAKVIPNHKLQINEGANRPQVL